MGLLIAREETLVVVRAMEIDKKVPQRAEQGQCARGAVHELPARPVNRDNPFDNEATVFARLDAVSVQ